MSCKQISHCLFPDKCRPYFAVSESIQWCGQPTDSDQYTRCGAGSQTAQGCTGSSEAAIRDRIPTSHYTFRWDDTITLDYGRLIEGKQRPGLANNVLDLQVRKNYLLLCSYVVHCIGFILYSINISTVDSTPIYGNVILMTYISCYFYFQYKWWQVESNIKTYNY